MSKIEAVATTYGFGETELTKSLDQIGEAERDLSTAMERLGRVFCERGDPWEVWQVMNEGMRIKQKVTSFQNRMRRIADE